jgi:hypothetical protein
MDVRCGYECTYVSNFRYISYYYSKSDVIKEVKSAATFASKTARREQHVRTDKIV